jgi:hypothetical protein
MHIYIYTYIHIYNRRCWTWTDGMRGMLTYADVCGRMLTYADVCCWRKLTYADVCWRMQVLDLDRRHETNVEVISYSQVFSLLALQVQKYKTDTFPGKKYKCWHQRSHFVFAEKNIWTWKHYCCATKGKRGPQESSGFRSRVREDYEERAQRRPGYLSLFVCVCVFVCVCAYIHTCIHTYIRIYIHT